jgi:hypothetical protein
MNDEEFINFEERKLQTIQSRLTPYDKQVYGAEIEYIQKLLEILRQQEKKPQTKKQKEKTEKTKKDVEDKFKQLINHFSLRKSSIITDKQVPDDAMEDAHLVKAATKYYANKENDVVANQYLEDNGLKHYKIDNDLSNEKGLVVENTRTGKVKVNYRGTDAKGLNTEDFDYDARVYFGREGNHEHLKSARKQMKSVIDKYGKENVERVNGFSLGGNKALTIGQEFKVDSRGFNSYIGKSHYNATPSYEEGLKHEIFRTSEDLPSIASTYLDGTNNLEVRTIPVKKNSTNPYKAHKLEQFTSNDPRTDDPTTIEMKGKRAVETALQHGELQTFNRMLNKKPSAPPEIMSYDPLTQQKLDTLEANVKSIPDPHLPKLPPDRVAKMKQTGKFDPNYFDDLPPEDYFAKFGKKETLIPLEDLSQTQQRQGRRLFKQKGKPLESVEDETELIDRRQQPKTDDNISRQTTELENRVLGTQVELKDIPKNKGLGGDDISRQTTDLESRIFGTEPKIRRGAKKISNEFTEIEKQFKQRKMIKNKRGRLPTNETLSLDNSIDALEGRIMGVKVQTIPQPKGTKSFVFDTGIELDDLGKKQGTRTTTELDTELGKSQLRPPPEPEQKPMTADDLQARFNKLAEGRPPPEDDMTFTEWVNKHNKETGDKMSVNSNHKKTLWEKSGGELTDEEKVGYTPEKTFNDLEFLDDFKDKDKDDRTSDLTDALKEQDKATQELQDHLETPIRAEGVGNFGNEVMKGLSPTSMGAGLVAGYGAKEVLNWVDPDCKQPEVLRTAEEGGLAGLGTSFLMGSPALPEVVAGTAGYLATKYSTEGITEGLEDLGVSKPVSEGIGATGGGIVGGATAAAAGIGTAVATGAEIGLAGGAIGVGIGAAIGGIVGGGAYLIGKLFG